jgi:hypothetical protein
VGAVMTERAGYVPESSGIPELIERITSEHPGERPHPVTHWHLSLTEIGTNDPERYRLERVEQLQRANLAGTTEEPRQALRWITEQRAEAIGRASDPAAAARRRYWHTPELWEQAARHTWWILTSCPATPAGGGISIRDGWSVEVYAFPMAPMNCSRTH